MTGSIRTYDATIGSFRNEPAPTSTPIALEEVIDAKDGEDLAGQVLEKVNERLAIGEGATVPEGWPDAGRFRLTFRLEPVQ